MFVDHADHTSKVCCYGWLTDMHRGCGCEDMHPEPTGFMGATAHDFDDHRRCDPRVCPNAEQED